MKNFKIKREYLMVLAMITMFIDHFAVMGVSTGLINLETLDGYKIYTTMRIIGRLALPIYITLFLEGFKYTHNYLKRFFRILAMAIVTEIFFSYVVFGITPSQLLKMQFPTQMRNVLFNFAYCSIVLGLSRKFIKDKPFVEAIAYLVILVLSYLLIKGTKIQWDYDVVIIEAFTMALIFRKIPFLSAAIPSLMCSEGWCTSFGPVVTVGLLIASITIALMYEYQVKLFESNEYNKNKIINYIFRYFYMVHLAILAGIKYIILK